MPRVNLPRSPKTVTGVFAGGGIRGIALAGAAAEALALGYHFERVVGTSAGAMIGSLLAAGYDADEIVTGVGEVPWGEFADHAPGGRLPLLGKHVTLMSSRALYRGDRMEEIWTELLARKGVETFADLPPRSLRVVATDITHQRGVVLPDGLHRYGLDPAWFPVARAVRISASVPFVFQPVKLREPGVRHGSLLVDGALAANFPLRLVDSGGPPALGFRLVNAPGIHLTVPVRGPASLARAVIGSAIRAADSLPMLFGETATIVDVPAGGDPLAFDIDAAEREELFAAGRDATRFALGGGPEPLRPVVEDVRVRHILPRFAADPI